MSVNENTQYRASRIEMAYFRSTMLLQSMMRQGVIVTIRVSILSIMLRTVRFSWMAAKLIRWRLSPIVSEAVLFERETVCNGCKSLTMADTKAGQGRFCTACGCPNTRWSELSVKNSRAGHNCPMGLHEGSRKDFYLLAFGGCKGCGGKPQTPADGNGQAPEEPAGREPSPQPGSTDAPSPATRLKQLVPPN